MPGARVFQASVGTSAAQLITTPLPLISGAEIEGIPANTDSVYLGFSDWQTLVWSVHVPSAGTFDLLLRDLCGTPYSFRAMPYNLSSSTTPTIATVQAAIRAASPDFAGMTITGTSTLAADSGLTFKFLKANGDATGKQFPLMTVNIANVTVAAGGLLTPAYSTSLTTSTGFPIAAGTSYRVKPEECTDASNIWTISGTASQTACVIAS